MGIVAAGVIVAVVAVVAVVAAVCCLCCALFIISLFIVC